MEGYLPHPFVNDKIKRKHNKLRRLCEAQNHRCAYCLMPLAYAIINNRIVCSTGNKRPTIDHFIPLSEGGKNKERNMVAACYRCNNKKKSTNSLQFYKERVISFIFQNKISEQHKNYYLNF